MSVRSPRDARTYMRVRIMSRYECVNLSGVALAKPQATGKPDCGAVLRDSAAALVVLLIAIPAVWLCRAEAAAAAPPAPLNVGEPRQLRGHTGAVTCAAFTANGERLVSGSLDGTLRLWDVSAGKEVRQLPAQIGCVWDVVFLPDDQRVLCVGEKGMGTWDTRSGKRVGRFTAAGGPFKAVAVSRDGRYAATCGGKALRVWHVDDGRQIREFLHPKTVVDVAVSSGGRYAVSASADAVLRLWDIAANKEIGHKQPPGFTSHDCLALSTDDRTCVFSGRAVAAAGLWDIRTGRAYWLGRKPSFTTFAAGIAMVAVSPDGRHILTVGTDDRIRIWDAETREELHQFAGRAGGIDVICFSPLGDSVLSAGQDAVIRLWAMPKEFAGICPSRSASATLGPLSPGGQVVSAVQAEPTTPVVTPVQPSPGVAGGVPAPGSVEAGLQAMAALTPAAKRPISSTEMAKLVRAITDLETIPAGRLIAGGAFPSSVDALVKKFEELMEVKAILAKHGFKTRDFVEKMFVVLLAVIAIDNGGPAGLESAVTQMASGPLGNSPEIRRLRALVDFCKIIHPQTYNSVRAMREQIVKAFNE